MRRILSAILVLCVLQASPALTADEQHHSNGAASPFSLNKGKKWAADNHTVTSVASMRPILRNAQQEPAKASIEELRAVGKQLQDGLQSLIRGCTMTGPAHNQLHTWISLLAPEIERLTKAEQIDTGRATLAKISGLLDSFDEQFEMAPPPA